jgi:hypothetical protein
MALSGDCRIYYDSAGFLDAGFTLMDWLIEMRKVFTTGMNAWL